jgi:divalent metal cation (Fe/Co/Zn/Cd) transporter
MPVLDGVASILIGVLLAAVALFLIGESRKLLVGEGVDRHTEREIWKIAADDPLVESVRRPLTMYLGPGDALLRIDVRFRTSGSAKNVAGAIERMKDRIRKYFPDLERIYVEAEAATPRRNERS